jgi:tRNA-dihydrouridine synthase B
MPNSTFLPFGPDEPWLAPLAGFSDLPFRLLCREHGAAAACTEMVSAKGLVYNSPGTGPLLDTCARDTPLVVQLFGREPEFIARAMADLLGRGFALFDLNAGCSVPKVVKTGAGAALLKDPEGLLAVAGTMISAAGPGRVGVKLRLGWEAGAEVYLDLARRLEDLGAGWLTLHPRYARQGFSGRADWDALLRLRRAVSIPVLGSGDLLTAGDARDCLDRTGIAGVMFARGAIHDPAIFGRLTGRYPPAGMGAQGGGFLAGLIRRHAELVRTYGNERQALFKMRTIVPGYLRHLPGCRGLRKSLTLCTSWEALDDIVSTLDDIRPGEGLPETPTIATEGSTEWK